MMHVCFIGFKRHPGEIAGKNMVRPLFLLKKFFCLVEILVNGFGVWFSGIYGQGGLRIPGLVLPIMLVLSFIMSVVGLLMVIFALDAGLDILAITEHRLIPARVRSEWARLRSNGVASIWAPASQDSSHVGNAGVGVVSLKGAPLSLPNLCYYSVQGVL